LFWKLKINCIFFKRRTLSGICGSLVLYDCDNLGTLNISDNINYSNQSCVNGCCTQLLICDSYLCNSLTPVPLTTTTRTTSTNPTSTTSTSTASKSSTSTTSKTSTSTASKTSTGTTSTRDPNKNGSTKVIFTDSFLKNVYLLVLYIKTILFLKEIYY
jgi:hypothetical protein